MPTSSPVLIDDRLLVAYLLGQTDGIPEGTSLHTTTYWYYRACRAAVAGGAGQLSGPFRALAADEQGAAITAMLQLPDRIGLPAPRLLVPAMVDVHLRHRQLNLLNLEATAAARVLSARVLLSPPAASGLLGDVLTAEAVDWDVVTPP